MREKYRGNIEVKYREGDDVRERNKKRHEAIKEHFSDIQINKQQFLDYIQKKDLHEGKNDVIERIRSTDFSNANPRNNSFMNELAFAGQSITEGFLEVFYIEQNKALEKYKDQLQVIEQKKDGKSQYYIGTFQNDKLKRLTPYKDKKEELEHYLEKQQEEKRSQKKEQRLELKREEHES